MKRSIRKVAVLGAGVMGAQIAAHLANSNVDVVLFDLAAKDGDKSAIAKGAIGKMAKLKPPPFAAKGLESRIKPANYEDDLVELESCDLLIEAISERLDWKKDLYDRIEPHIADHAILATNTSGLGINELATVLNEKLRQRFLCLHFFNPPRYMHLVEVIPCNETLPEVLEVLEPFFVTTLGKGLVIAKDTPNFIGNRIGIFSLLATMHHANELQIPLEVVDQITGKPLGRPKSGTYRTMDVVGLDTMKHAINTMDVNLKDDPWSQYYKTPQYILDMVEEGVLGQKTGKGIYAQKGKQVFSPAKSEYVAADQKFDKDVAAMLRGRDWAKNIQALKSSDHPQAQFIYRTLTDLFHYCLVTLEEIAHCARDVDMAIRWGFGWAMGPFEIIQAIGLKNVVNMLSEEMQAGNLMAAVALPQWVNDIDDIHNPQGSYSPKDNTYVPLSSNAVYNRQALPENVVGSKSTTELGDTIFETDSVRMWHQGDDVAIISFKSKMHTVNIGVIEGVLKAIDEAEKNYSSLVVWHPDAPFSLGADLKEAMAHHEAGEVDKIDYMIRQFQAMTMALKHCYVPTVAAVQGMALGGGCEIQMHCDVTVAAQESYIGLVEAGIGLLPAASGSKEMAARAASNARGGDLMPHIQSAFQSLAMAKVSASGLDAIDMGLMTDNDRVIANPHELLHVAKAQARAMAQSGYRPVSRSQKVKVAGKPGKATLMMMAVNMLEGHFISEHDYLVADRIATILTGGDVEQGSYVSYDWLLKLEVESFIELLKTEKTQARIAHTLTTGKPLRN